MIRCRPIFHVWGEHSFGSIPPQQVQPPKMCGVYLCIWSIVRKTDFSNLPIDQNSPSNLVGRNNTISEIKSNEQQRGCQEKIMKTTTESWIQPATWATTHSLSMQHLLPQGDTLQSHSWPAGFTKTLSHTQTPRHTHKTKTKRVKYV